MQFLSKFIGIVITLTISVVQAASQVDALHLDWIDKSNATEKNFYAYANGTWLKQNPIPPQYSSWGTFSILHESVEKKVQALIINASKDTKAKPGSIQQKVGDFYYSGMNEKAINQLGITPLFSDFIKIDVIKNRQDLEDLMIYLQQIGVDIGFNFGSMQDFKKSDEMIGALGQGGLGLPDRDYYLNDNDKFKKIRSAYVAHIAKMLILLGDTPQDSAKEANTVMNIETMMAKASMSQIEQRDPQAIYHIMTVSNLDKLTENFSWTHYLQAIGHPEIKHLNLAMPDFFKTFNQLLQTIPISDWKTYLRWHLIDSFAPFLSKPFVQQNFQMVSVLTGSKKLLPRWQRVVNTEEGALGFAIGQLYVDKYFPPSSKQQVLEILANIRKELARDLKTLSWMTPKTREAALKKLALIEERVGYPKKWWDYTALVIDRGPYVLNIKRANQFLFKRDLNKIGKPIDRSEWAMTPQTINAYYDPSMNNINIPAGILQAPFFDPNAPEAINYGSIGFVIGHEITHGFDDQGAKFNGHGNLENWWTAQDLKKFQAATNCLVQQFSQYTVDKDMHVQGKLVVGEATADLGGLILAYRAFHDSKAYQSAKTIDGFTPDQQFFLGVAHVWATNMRLEQMRNQVTIDPHPPAKYRVNGTLANMPQFQKAFNIPANSPMVNVKRCVIW